MEKLDKIAFNVHCENAIRKIYESEIFPLLDILKPFVGKKVVLTTGYSSFSKKLKDKLPDYPIKEIPGFAERTKGRAIIRLTSEFILSITVEYWGNDYPTISYRRQYYVGNIDRYNGELIELIEPRIEPQIDLETERKIVDKIIQLKEEIRNLEKGILSDNNPQY